MVLKCSTFFCEISVKPIKWLVKQKRFVVISAATTNGQEKTVQNNLNNTEKQSESVSTTEVSQQNEPMTYHTPKLLRYGGLAELVQRRPGRAMDGETMFVDCTLT